MKIRTIIKLLILSVTVLLVSEGCKSTNQTGSAVVDSGSAAGAAAGGAAGMPDTTGFLMTDYKPLDDWMNERFNVNYQAMTLELIFDQVPISDIHYQKSNLPSGGPAFYFQSPDITRRQLLKKIAQHWNLNMEFIKGSDGNPSAVKVTGKA